MRQAIQYEELVEKITYVEGDSFLVIVKFFGFGGYRLQILDAYDVKMKLVSGAGLS